MKIFITDIKQIINRQNFVSAQILKLSEKDKARFDNIKCAKRALQFLIGRLLISEHLGQDFKTLPSGKVVSSKSYLSIAHSGDFVVLSISEEPVGVDIEKINSNRDFQKIAQRLEFNNVETAEDFYRAFTAYEADFKLGSKVQNLTHCFFKCQDFLICVSAAQKALQNIEIFECLPFERTEKITLQPF